MKILINSKKKKYENKKQKFFQKKKNRYLFVIDDFERAKMDIIVIILLHNIYTRARECSFGGVGQRWR